jgi:hypothetical protein
MAAGVSRTARLSASFMLGHSSPPLDELHWRLCYVRKRKRNYDNKALEAVVVEESTGGANRMPTSGKPLQTKLLKIHAKKLVE